MTALNTDDIRGSLRKEKLKLRKALGKPYMEEASECIFQKLLRLEDIGYQNRFLIYIDYNNEVITRPIINKLLLNGKEVFAPGIHGQREMDFYRIYSIGEIIHSPSDRGGLGIPHPPMEDERRYHYLSGKDVLIAPIVAFDAGLNRLGYGGGYYDTFLNRFHLDNRIGIAFECQYADTTFPELWDIPMTMIITERKIYD